MSVIRKLSQEIIGQIAAGEVVERPAAAVKELVENSIDAGARNVTVELREGGIKYLRVSDNGRGIPAEQIRMAFERHATSKISEAKDLFDIQTLGFRGEALASIAAVAKVTCTTRTTDADFGTRAVVEAGEFTDIRQAASPVGTTIVAEDLFYNTPVRLKFLKKPATEAAMVSDYMLRLILSHPEVAFRYVSQGKTIYRSMGDGKLESALYAVYGGDAFRQMRKVSGHMNGVLVSGYAGTGELARGNRQQQSFFVNGRYFRSAALSQALEKGCEGRVMIGRFPMCALFLEVPRQMVDVNVHPNKLEVRFQNEAAVAAAVEMLVREAMQGESLSGRLQPVDNQPSVEETKSVFTVRELVSPPQAEDVLQKPVLPEKEKTEKPKEPSAASAASAPAAVSPQVMQAIAHLEPVVIESPRKVEALHQKPAVFVQSVPDREEKTVVQPKAQKERETVVAVPDRPVEAPKPIPVPIRPAEVPKPVPTAKPAEETQEQTVLPVVEKLETPLRMVGILFDTYWIFETGDRVLMVDQHAAHERMLYDQMMARFENEHVSQTLLAPQLVRLSPHDMAMLPEFAPVLAQAGFEIEPFDDKSIALRAIPTFFGVNDSPKELLLEALTEWQSGKGTVTRDRLRHRVAQMACKRAIKGGDRLSEVEIRGFMKEMLKSDSIPNCPHGRPIVTEMTRYELEKRFKRVQ